jgi:hypothetical protein
LFSGQQHFVPGSIVGRYQLEGIAWNHECLPNLSLEGAETLRSEALLLMNVSETDESLCDSMSRIEFPAIEASTKHICACPRTRTEHQAEASSCD